MKKAMPAGRQGQMLVAAVFVLVVVAILGVATVSMISTESFSAARGARANEALNIAESGVRFTIASSLDTDSDWSNNTDFGPVNLSPGTFTVRYLYKTQNACTLEVTGTVSGVSRVVTVKLNKSAGGGPNYPEAFNYGVFRGNMAGWPNTFSVGAAGMNTIITGDVYSDGNVAVPAGSAVSGGKIYVSPGHMASGAGSYTWEVDASPPTMPTLDATYYETKITSYDALVPPGSPPNRTYGGTTVVTLTGNTITALNFTIQQNAVIKGYGVLAAQRYIYLYNSAVISPEGGTIVLTAGRGVNINNAARVRPGTEIYTRSYPIQVLNAATVEGSLLMSRSMITVTNTGTVSRESILYTAASASTVNLAQSAQIGGSVIAQSMAGLSGGTGQTLNFTGLLYVPTQIVYVNQVNFRGAIVADRYNTDRIINSRIRWDSSYLPGTRAPGIPAGGGGGSGEVTTTDWSETY